MLCASFAFAQAPTAAGTIIENQATGSFVPEGDTIAKTVESNKVTTEVLPVYNINVEPDTSVGQGDGTQLTDPGPADGTGSGDPSNAEDNNFAGAPVGQPESGNPGSEVVLEYSVENLSNTPSDVTLAVKQDTSDNFDLQNPKIYEDTNNNGTYDPGVDQEVTGPITLPASDGTPGSGPDEKDLFVVGTIPATQNGDTKAKIDLVATNDTAVAAGANTDSVNNSYQVFENNNIAEITVNATSDIGIAKALTAGPTSNGDGTFNATFTYTVENFGNVVLDTINLTDDLTTIFGTNAATVVSGTNGSSLVYNTANDGQPLTATTNILAASTLAAGATDAVTVTVQFNAANFTAGKELTAANNYQASFDNVANVTAETPADATVEDAGGSVNGTNPDPNDNGNPDDDASPTPVPFKIKPAISMVKSAQVTLDDGTKPTYRVAYTVFVENTGDVALTNVAITDDLIRAFTDLEGANAGTAVAPANIVIDTAPSIQYITDPTKTTNPTETTDATPNASFDGKTAATQTLATSGTTPFEPGEKFSVSFVVLVTPKDASGTLLDGKFDNQADATAKDPVGNDVTDASDNGSSFDDIDPDGDGLGNEQTQDYDDDGNGTTDPNEGDVNDDGTVGNGTTGNENDPTPVNLGEDPTIGVAKQAGTVVDNNDGSFNVPFTMTVENFGNVVLSNVQVTDDLVAAFPAPATFTIVPGSFATTGGLTANTNFDGNTDKNLLAGTDSLNPNASGTVTFTVKLSPNGAPSPFENRASAEGTSPKGTKVTDDSVDGPDPDGTDNDNNPDEDSPTPVNLPEKAQLGVAKEAAVGANVGTAANPEFNVTYTVRVENIGNVNITNVQVADNLSTVFNSAASFAVTGTPPVNVTTGTVTPNPNYNGTTDTNLLTGSDTLAPKAFAILTFTVKVAPGSNSGPYNNQAVATGKSPKGTDVTDDSDNGTQVDSDGDGLANEQNTPYDEDGNGTTDPNEGVEADTPGDGLGNDTNDDNNDPTPVTFPKVTEVKLLKDAYVYKTNPTTCDKATAGANTNEVAGPTGKTDRFTESSDGDPTKLDTYAVPGEFICYTVVATNTGAANVTQLEIADVIPAGTLFAISPANAMVTQDASITTPEIECSQDNGSTYVACTGTALGDSGSPGDGIIGNNGETPVTNVRIKQNPTLAQTQTTILRFVVYIP